MDDSPGWLLLRNLDPDRLKPGGQVGLLERRTRHLYILAGATGPEERIDRRLNLDSAQALHALHPEFLYEEGVPYRFGRSRLRAASRGRRRLLRHLVGFHRR